MASEFRCTQCGRVLQAGDAAPGTRMLCPGCGAFSTVPAPEVGPPIEFRCTQCNKLLRTPAETAGKQAKCPECGAILSVPAAGAGVPGEGAPGGPAFPPPGPEAGSPFTPGGGPVAQGDVENPYEAPQQPSGIPQIDTGYTPRRHVPNYLVQAILCTLFCCLPFGVVAIVFAAQVNGKLAAGDYAGAASFSDSARMWCWVSFWLGLIPMLLWILVICASGFSGM